MDCKKYIVHTSSLPRNFDSESKKLIRQHKYTRLNDPIEGKMLMVTRAAPNVSIISGLKDVWRKKWYKIIWMWQV